MDDPEHLEPEDDEEDEGGPLVTVEIVGLSLYTHHGVGDAEREVGQRLVFDLSFELSDCDATLTDRVEDTVDYAAVCEQVALAAQERS
jgi:dihydroneopterin aldolase